METYVNDAETIWNDFKKRRLERKFQRLTDDEKLDFYQNKYNQFAMTFPIVLRYMVQLRQYNKKAFVKFVTRLTNYPYKSELEYCERQADYVKYLFMETSKSHNMRDAQSIWQNTYDMLAKEVKMFKDAEAVVKSRNAATALKNKGELRAELKELLNAKSNSG